MPSLEYKLYLQRLRKKEYEWLVYMSRDKTTNVRPRLIRNRIDQNHCKTKWIIAQRAVHWKRRMAFPLDGANGTLIKRAFYG